MGIYIKNIEMPKDGYIDVRIFAEGHANIATGEAPFYKEMPIVEIHPHGRLIDADELSFRLLAMADCEWNQTVGTSWADAYEEVNEFLEEAPTIIEAEVAT